MRGYVALVALVALLSGCDRLFGLLEVPARTVDAGDASDASGGGDARDSATGPVSMVEICAGTDHTCAIRRDTGAVRCWGAAVNGRLGYGNTTTIGDDETPATAGDVLLPAADRVVAGGAHTCVLMRTGAVRCWGLNINGQLGYAHTVTIGDDEPPIGDIMVGGAAIQVDAGTSHTCALLGNGAVRCWGIANNGRLGYANPLQIGDDEHPSTAGNVGLGGTATQIALGDAHSCALLDNGNIRCWGSGGLGRLGLGDENDIGDNELPSTAGPIDVGGAATGIAAGGAHTCARLMTGAVRCWGSGSSGQLGYGNLNDVGDNELPASVGDVSVGAPVIAIAAGSNHTCALLDTGAVRCWGDGSKGQLGYGNTASVGDNEVPAFAGDVMLGETAIGISAGGNHTCAVLASDAIACWGNNVAGAVGTPGISIVGDNETPAAVGPVSVF